MASNRETARDALVALLETALVGSGLPVKTVVGSKVTSLEGVTPLVQVLGRGSERTALTTAGDWAIFLFSIQIFVLQSKDDWTYANAEDALDAIEALIAGICEDEDRTDNWEVLQYDGPTSIMAVVSSGTPYYLESIPVRIVLGGN